MPKERVERDEEDLVRLYLTDIGQYPLLTKDDEVRLAQQIEVGIAAREELDATENLTVARKRELRRSSRQGEEAGDAGHPAVRRERRHAPGVPGVAAAHHRCRERLLGDARPLPRCGHGQAPLVGHSLRQSRHPDVVRSVPLQFTRDPRGNRLRHGSTPQSTATSQ